MHRKIERRRQYREEIKVECEALRSRPEIVAVGNHKGVIKDVKELMRYRSMFP